ncbi:hypothetical protein HOP62_01335 [Halomonas sp. MCCC 1A17488]|uniref:hypothetical protein n=1 Tax=unclassified Halomonas TaxID=2609666 RepID=UPI0018D22227|nr:MULTISPECIES: hypothetical protein [unclassified Halomonas]MCE8014716.1 hypothetical protein [Halomonas sp. MCCC 1A17488]MCG3238049.1 hypothetical protein [Halomonas sp. MCCC 1A17488]QPP48174.1 hypothetical protein I4484_13065 [Halomonas sp. SS10-MC5]
MIPFALGRHTGLALSGPARLLLPVLMVLVLSACRDQSDEHLIQGTALGTGYHITLYADLDQTQVAALEAGIQGEMATLERQRSVFTHALATAFRRFWIATPGLQHEVDRQTHVLAVDRLVQWLEEHRPAPAAVLVELGGVLRAQGESPDGGWRLSLELAGLPGPDGARHLRLRNAALVHRFARQERVPLLTLTTPLAVSVIAPSASEAMHQASRLMQADPEHALALAESMDSAARVVVKTPQGIEIQHTAALEPWLEP